MLGLWVSPGTSPTSYHIASAVVRTVKNGAEEVELPMSLNELW